MRQLLSSWLIGLIALGVVACDRPAASTRPSSRSGEFRVLLPGRPTTLNPNLDLDELAHVIGRNLFNQLLSVNEAGRLLPELAESWTVSPDGRTYTFTLRRGVTWHDGTPFTAADVQWTLDAISRDGVSRDALRPMSRIDTPDPQTVVISLAHAWAPFASDLATFGVSILPRHLYEGRDWRNHPGNARPIGTGPFKFGHWRDANTLVLEANDRYFRPGPFVDRVVFSSVPVEQVSETLQRHGADLSLIRPPELSAGSAMPDAVAIRTLPSSARVYLAMNLRQPPFSDVRVRRAIAALIDRAALIREGMGGLGAPAVGWYTPDVEWAYNPHARVPDQDESAALQLLDAAGLRPRDGVRARTTLITPDAPPYPEVARALQRQLARVGIITVIERLPLDEWTERVFHAHQFSLTLVAGTQGPDPDTLRRRFLADSDGGAYIGYSNPRFRDAVEHGARTVDIQERAAAYWRAQDVLAEDVPFIPLAENVKVVVSTRRVTGLPQLEARGLVGAYDFSLVKVGAGRADPPR